MVVNVFCRSGLLSNVFCKVVFSQCVSAALGVRGVPPLTEVLAPNDGESPATEVVVVPSDELSSLSWSAICRHLKCYAKARDRARQPSSLRALFVKAEKKAGCRNREAPKKSHDR